jgi:transcriptional regulator with XRE-family HTH domain
MSRGAAGPGDLIREWRSVRRVSQMTLAFDAGISPRHMSFIETGRSRASRETLLAICAALEMPLREQNIVLEAGGHAREYSETSFDAGENAHLRSVVTHLLDGHDPWFAVAIDHRWDILEANRPAELLLHRHFDIGPLPGPRNLLRLTLHPDGLRPAIGNLDAVAGRLLRTLDRQVALRPGDDGLSRLRDEVHDYGPEGRGSRMHDERVPMILETSCGTAELLTILLAFDNPLDPLREELRIETLVPGTEESARVLREAWARLEDEAQDVGPDGRGHDPIPDSDSSSAGGGRCGETSGVNP